MRRPPPTRQRPPRRPPAATERAVRRRPRPPAKLVPDTSTRALDEQIQDLKKSVVDLNEDLFVLEEELLFPANTQVAVFVSMDVGEFFGLDAVTLKIDNREVSNYLYTPREVAALSRAACSGCTSATSRPDRTNWWRYSPARAPTIVTTAAAHRSNSRRA